MRRFYIATLSPIPILAVASFWGGWWAALALLQLTVIAYALDTLVKSVGTSETNSEFPAGDGLLMTLGCLHFPLFAMIVWRLSSGDLSLAESIAVFFAAGLFFGQVSNSAAHELIHRNSRLLHRLGMWMYISQLFGHHTSAHVLIHHRHVATDADPSSARLGQSYYSFVRQAWAGSFRQGFIAEQDRLARINRSSLKNPYFIYVLGGLLLIAISALLGGWTGVIVYIGLAIYATLQLLLSDYVQHYGLRRNIDETGKPETVCNRHSWNSPHWFSSGFMLNAPRHSDHHAHPGRTFASLELPEDGPTLPRSLPVMASLALWPPVWRRVMDHRAAKWGA